MSRVAKCKGCGAEILYRYTPNKRLMPLDVGTSGTAAPGTYVVTSYLAGVEPDGSYWSQGGSQ